MSNSQISVQGPFAGHRKPRNALGTPAALVLTVLAGVIAVGPAACGRGGGRPNILLISVDTLRADHLGCYGHDRPTSPSIDRLAGQGVTFDNAVANSPWTLPSHGSLLTGLYPRTHALKSHRTGLREDVPTLASVLESAGYATAGLVNSHHLSPRYGLHRGFQEYRYYREWVDMNRPRSAADQVQRAIQWIGEVGEKPFFLFLHNYDVHSSYVPSPRFRKMLVRPYAGPLEGSEKELEKIRSGELVPDEADIRYLVDLYDAGLRELDHDLSRLLEFLSESGLDETTYVILTSDHGEEFLEHGGVLHGRTMYEEVLRVPLIIRGPGVPAGRRFDHLAQLTDLYPTILSLAGIAEGTPVEGIDLSPAWSAGGIGPRLAFAEADHNDVEDDIKKMVREGSVKVILDRLREEIRVFDLAEDPAELRDLGDDSETARRLLEHLHEYMAHEETAVELPPLSGEQSQTLKSLGYLP